MNITEQVAACLDGVERRLGSLAVVEQRAYATHNAAFHKRLDASNLNQLHRSQRV
jgi:hypothetical protein